MHGSSSPAMLAGAPVFIADFLLGVAVYRSHLDDALELLRLEAPQLRQDQNSRRRQEVANWTVHQRAQRMMGGRCTRSLYSFSKLLQLAQSSWKRHEPGSALETG